MKSLQITYNMQLATVDGNILHAVVLFTLVNNYVKVLLMRQNINYLLEKM